MNKEVEKYNSSQLPADQEICDRLASIIDEQLTNAENKIWHAHPVWFLDGNPIVGYSKQKKGIRLMFWSGADFEEERLNVLGNKFKDASIFYQSILDIDSSELVRWLEKSEKIQWDYKNIVKRKGVLVKLT